jgi:gluconokinase
VLNDEAEDERSDGAEAHTSAETEATNAVPPFVLALDIGTSSVRAAFYDGLAREIRGTGARIRRSFCTTADGGAEDDAEESVSVVARVIDAALARAPKPITADTKGVAVSCFWHSLVGVGEDGRALTPVLGWADTRASAAAGELRRLLDESTTHARTGCRFHASYWPAKLIWLYRQNPALTDTVRRWMSFGEFLALRLAGGGEFGVSERSVAGVTTASISMASGTGLFNQRSCAWDATLLADLQCLARLPLDIEQLPTVAEHNAVTYTLSDEYAARWPVLRGRAIFPAVADGAANNIGAGCIAPQAIALMVATSGAMRVMREADAPCELPPALWCYRADAKRVVVGGALSDGGGLREWMLRTMLFEADADASVERELAAMEPDAHGLTVLPFWAGERSTGWNEEARGGILGLTMHTRPSEILRASMEAVAYRLAGVADALAAFAAPEAEIRASGGALRRSPAWTQIVADVLGRPVKLLNINEASSRGAVLLALEALGEIKSIADVDAPSGDVYEPCPSHHARYTEARTRQQKFYELLINHPSDTSLNFTVSNSETESKEI